MDCVRAVIVGAEGTPYHDGLFFFDVCFPSGYPNVPPEKVLFVFWNRLQSARLEDLRPKVNGKRSGIEKQKGLEKAAKLQYLGHSSSLYLSEKTDMFYATQKRMLPNAYWLFTATVMEEALNGVVTTHPLPLEPSIMKKVEKQCDHCYSVTIPKRKQELNLSTKCNRLQRQVQAIILDQEEIGGLSVCLQMVEASWVGKSSITGAYPYRGNEDGS
ncbi:hypothetical protein ACFX13_033691 [Malus domestica]